MLPVSSHKKITRRDEDVNNVKGSKYLVFVNVLYLAWRE